MIQVHRLQDGGCTTQEGIPALPRASDATGCWIELVAPSPEEVLALSGLMALHPLAVEDALQPQHPPKIESFGEYLFVIAHTPLVDGDGHTAKLAIFLGKGWIATLARGSTLVMGPVRERILARSAHYLGEPAYAFHALLDYLTDGIEHRVDALIDQVETMQDRVLNGTDTQVMRHLAGKRRTVARLVRVVRAQRDVLGTIMNEDDAIFPKEVWPYLRDVHDHALRLNELLESVREAIGGLRDTHLSAINARMSESMRVLMVIATIMLPLSLIAGVYGMNFDDLPGRHAPLGFWITLALMAFIAVGMLTWFRRRRWI